MGDHWRWNNVPTPLVTARVKSQNHVPLAAHRRFTTFTTSRITFSPAHRHVHPQASACTQAMFAQ